MDLIKVTMSSNEQGSTRAAGLANALMDDPRFEWHGYEQIPVDLQFSITTTESWPIDRDYEGKLWREPEEVTKQFNCELKEPADYIASALGPSGHLYQQILAMRELEHPCMVLVLGSDDDITNAIKDATKTRYKGQERAYQIGSYSDRLIDFESQCWALGCVVARWKATPWKRLLSLVHKTLTGGNLMSYRPKPANGERELAAASMLFGQGIGPAVLKPVLAEYKLALIPRGAFARQPCDLPGIGPKRAAVIDERIKMVYGV